MGAAVGAVGAAGQSGFLAVLAERLEASAERIVARVERIVDSGSDADALRAAELWMLWVYGPPVAARPSGLEDLVPVSPAERAEFGLRLVGSERDGVAPV